MAPRILLVDGEGDIHHHLDPSLHTEYTIAVVRTGAEALAELSHRTVDLVILDVSLPDMPGNEVCRRIRGQATTREVPLILISKRNTEIDRVVGLELGADDFVVKPFSARELALRIAAILRRSTPPAAQDTALRIGEVEIDVDAHRVRVNGADVGLTLIEFRLLHDLVTRRGRVQSRDALLERIWGHAEPTRTIDTHVKRLRTKLGPARDLIETIRGLGYRVRAEDE